jgi:D-alanyl-lipoteichoic acid acyltransferase DltB (MBOAT superfamily)
MYCDFSGYSDIAIGASQVMGITLMNNFRRPYFAGSVAEFWTRWHISLSTWFRDYLYIPLGGNRVNEARWCFNIFLVFLLSGLWHGASWTFIAWGIVHGLYLIIGKFSKSIRSKIVAIVGLAKFPVFNKLLNVSVTFIVVSITWIFFRASTIHQALYLIRSLFTHWQIHDVHKVIHVFKAGKRWLSIVLFFMLLLGGVQFYQEKYGSVRELISRQSIATRWAIYLSALYAIVLFGAFENIPFIYFQF